MRCAPVVWLFACSQAIAVKDSETLEVTPSDAASTPEDGDDDEVVSENEAPIADAGPDTTAFVAEQIELDGSASYDPDGDPIEYDWTMLAKPSGSVSSLINDSRPNPSFYADREGVYTMEVAVSDALEVSLDEVQVLVEAPNEGPVANGGPDQVVAVGDRVVLNGSASYDPDGDPVDFAWTLFSRPGGSSAVLDAPSSALPGFTADVEGLYVIDVEVTDGVDTSLPDQVRVTATVDGGDTGCLSCAAAERQMRRRMGAGTAANIGIFGLLPLAIFVARRRRR